MVPRESASGCGFVGYWRRVGTAFRSALQPPVEDPPRDRPTRPTRAAEHSAKPRLVTQAGPPARVEGLEPPTRGFGDRCSTKLSYTRSRRRIIIARRSTRQAQQHGGTTAVSASRFDVHSARLVTLDSGGAERYSSLTSGQSATVTLRGSARGSSIEPPDTRQRSPPVLLTAPDVPERAVPPVVQHRWTPLSQQEVSYEHGAHAQPAFARTASGRRKPRAGNRRFCLASKVFRAVASITLQRSPVWRDARSLHY